jgi:hypothetical protein
MSDRLVTIVQSLDQGSVPPATIVTALLEAQKQQQQDKSPYRYEQLIGTWRLRAVSGTKMIRLGPASKPLKRPGKGRNIPGFAKLQITFSGDASGEMGAAKAAASEVVSCFSSDSFSESVVTGIGTIENAVSIGPLKLCLTGPTRFWPATNSLGFDLTALRLSYGDRTLYSGPIRGGQARDQQFKTQTLKDQAFFTFFDVGDRYIAARGKGGGLALWTRV